MIALLGILFPFIKGLLGDGLVEKVLTHKREQAKSATELEKANIEADIKALDAELKRREQIKALQIAEYEHPFLWWPKFLIMMVVAFYVAARFTAKTWGLSDFQIAVAELDPWEAGVASLVMTYMFLGGELKRAMSGKKNPG